MLLTNSILYLNDDKKFITEAKQIPKPKDLRYDYVYVDDTYLVVERFMAPFNHIPSIGIKEDSILITGNLVKAIYRTQEIVQIAKEKGYWYFVEINDINMNAPIRGWVFSGFCKIFNDYYEALSYSYDITKNKKKYIDNKINYKENYYKGLRGFSYIDASKKAVPVYLTPYPVTTCSIASYITDEVFVYSNFYASDPIDDETCGGYYRIILPNRKDFWIYSDDIYTLIESIDNYDTDDAASIIAKGHRNKGGLYDLRTAFFKYSRYGAYYDIIKIGDIFSSGGYNIFVAFDTWAKNTLNDVVVRAKVYEGIKTFNPQKINSEIKNNLEMAYDGHFIWDFKFSIFGEN